MLVDSKYTWPFEMFSSCPVTPWKQNTIKVKMILNKSIKQKPIGNAKQQGS